MKLGTHWVSAVLKMEFRQATAYRVDFWVQFLFSQLSSLGVAYFLWSSIFQARGVDVLGGYTFAAMMLYYCLVPLVDRIIRGYDNFAFSTEIYDGTLTRLLMIPVPALAFKFASHLAKSCVSFLQLGLGLGFFITVWGIPPEVTITLQSCLYALSLAFFVSLAYFLLASMIEMVSFWADNVWSLMVMLRFVVHLSAGALIPFEFFPESAKEILQWTIFPYLISKPIRLFLGYEGSESWSAGLMVVSIWILILGIVVNAVWRSGLRRYAGVGI